MNKGLSISINDDFLGNAGFEESGVVVCNIICGERQEINELTISVGGLKNAVWSKWVDQDLKVGDKIQIEITSGNFDPPFEKMDIDHQKASLESRLKTYYDLKEELKDHIKEE